MKRETLLVELCADWVARLDVNHGNPPTVAAAVISAAEANAVELPTDTATEADAVETPTEAEADAVATSTDTATGSGSGGHANGHRHGSAYGRPHFSPPVAVVNRRRLAAAVRRLSATVGKNAKTKTHKLALAVSVAVDSGAVFLQTFNNDAEAVEIIPAETGQNVRNRSNRCRFRHVENGRWRCEIRETVLIDATDAAALAVGAVQLPRVADSAEFPVVDVANFAPIVNRDDRRGNVG